MYFVTEYRVNGDVTYEYYNDPYRIGPTYTKQEIEVKYAHNPDVKRIDIKFIKVN